MNATNALYEILQAALRGDGPIWDVPVIMTGKCTVTMDDGTRVRLTAEIVG